MGANMINFFSNSIENVKKIIKYFISHWRRFLGILIIFIPSLISLKFFNVSEINSSESEQIIEIWGITIQNWGTWLAMIGIPIGAFWAIYQYDKQIAISQQEKAYEVARIFSNELLIETNIVGSVLESYGPLKKIYKKINLNSLKRFDIYEIIDITKDEKIFDEFNKIFRK